MESTFQKRFINDRKCPTAATRLVRSLKDYSYSERLRKLGLLTLEYRRERADLIQVYKILNNIDIVDKDKLFYSDTSCNWGRVEGRG